MLYTIAAYCTSILINNGIIEEKKRAVYIYGFQLFIATASSILSILLISLTTGNTAYGILYLVTFMSLRITANGFHAKTYCGCFLLSNGIFLLYLTIVNYLFLLINPIVDSILLVFCIIYIWRKAPIEHPNHKLSLKKWKKNQLAARGIICIDT